MAKNAPRRRTIGALAKEAGVGVETVRFYERKGLLDQPAASEGYRDYDDGQLATLKYIKIAQGLGFSLADIATLRSRLREGPAFCGAVRETARRRLERLEGEIAELRRLQGELTAFLARCETKPEDRPCQILAELQALEALAPTKPRKGNRS